MLSLQVTLPALRELPELPSVQYHLDLFKDCREKKSLSYLRHLHTHIHLHGLGAHEAFASHLILLFVQNGSLYSALQVFQGLPHRNVCSWNCLIEGFVEYGQFERALDLYACMKDDHVQSNGYTLQVLLKACAGLKSLEQGQEVHSEIVREGFESQPFIGSSIVDMYAKCGSLIEAVEVFESLTSRGVVAWTALMSGYAEHGLSDEVLSCLRQMQEESICPNGVTFVSCLKVCGSVEFLEKGHELHACIIKLGLEDNPIVLNALLGMYAKCESLQEAHIMFDALPSRCVVAWTTLILGYAEHGYSEEVSELMDKMKLDGVPPNEVTAVCCLKGCWSQEDLVVGRKIHIDVMKFGFEGNHFVGSALIDFYAKCGLLTSALLVFDRLPIPNDVCWNALIAGYAEGGLASEVWKCLEVMISQGVSVSATTFSSIVKACNKGGSLEMGLSVHAEIVREGLEKHPVIGSALVDMYASCGLPEEAQEVFDELLTREVVAWTALMAGYAEKDLVKDVLTCYEKMQAEGVIPNSFTYVPLVKACGCEGMVNRGHELHAEMVTKGLEKNSFLGSALVDMYARCSMLEEAQAVFDGLPARDVVLWSAWIAACAREGGMRAIDSFEKMKQEGILPEDITFSSILAVCSHEGLVDKGLLYFESMITEFRVTPTIEHSNCLVDLLGRAGQLSLAMALLNSTPEAPTLITWNILLGACKKWGRVDLGRRAFDYAVRLSEAEAGSYFLMSSIYADADMWAEAKIIDALRFKYAYL